MMCISQKLYNYIIFIIYYLPGLKLNLKYAMLFLAYLSTQDIYRWLIIINGHRHPLTSKLTTVRQRDTKVIDLQMITNYKSRNLPTEHQELNVNNEILV